MVLSSGFRREGYSGPKESSLMIWEKLNATGKSKGVSGAREDDRYGYSEGGDKVVSRLRINHVRIE